MTVLILASEQDPIADRIARELAARKTPTTRCDTTWIPHSVTLDAECHLGQWNGTLAIPTMDTKNL